MPSKRTLVVAFLFGVATNFFVALVAVVVPAPVGGAQLLLGPSNTPNAQDAGYAFFNGYLLESTLSSRLLLIAQWDPMGDGYSPQSQLRTNFPHWATGCWIDPANADLSDFPDQNERRLLVVTGWPFRSLGGGLVDRGAANLQRYSAVPMDGSLAGSPLALESQLLPLAPIYGGFVANTLIFAAAFAIIVSVLRFAQNLVAPRPGHCRACGYLHSAPTPCPECGVLGPDAPA